MNHSRTRLFSTRCRVDARMSCPARIDATSFCELNTTIGSHFERLFDIQIGNGYTSIQQAISLFNRGSSMNSFYRSRAAVSRSSGCRQRPLVLLVSLWATFVTAMPCRTQSISDPTQVAQQAEAQPQSLDDALMAMVIEAVKENEARYRNLETTTTITAEYDATKHFYTKRVETAHVVQQGELIYYRGSTEFQHADDPQRRFERLSAYDGERTRTVEVGNSANIHLARYEASQVYPPHTWAMKPLWVNFPLSVYLQGTPAVAAHPKVRRIPRPAGTVYEMTQVQCEYAGMEKVGDLSCHKIRCQRWSRLTSPPATHILWLAPERNYLCVKTQLTYASTGNELPSEESLVEEFREIAPGLWLPARIRFTSYDGMALRENRSVVDETEVLTLDQATLNPSRPVTFFRDVQIPDSLPVFTISAEGTMIDSPMHPVPADQPGVTSLEQIIAGVRSGEAKYDNYDLILSETYRHDEEQNSLLESNGVRTVSWEATQRNVFMQGKFYHSENISRTNELLAASASEYVVAFNGAWRRQLSVSLRGPSDEPQRSASLQKGSAGRQSFFRPHLALMENFTDGPSLADYLAGVEVAPPARRQQQVEYLGDELISGLVCHKLRVSRMTGQPPTPSSSTIIWLARDRNYLPIRREGMQPSRSEKLPGGIALVQELREARPGLWFPDRISSVKIRNFESIGTCENRIILSWRENQQIAALDLDPKPEPTLFSEINVPQGTDVAIVDEQGGVIGRRAQPQDGNISVTEEEYQELLKNRPARRR